MTYFKRLILTQFAQTSIRKKAFNAMTTMKSSDKIREKSGQH